MLYVHNGILSHFKKEANPAFLTGKMDMADIMLSEIKSDIERQILQDITYVWIFIKPST